MKIRKYLSLLLIAIFLLTMAMPIAATEPEVAPEEVPVESMPAPAEPDEMQVGFTVQQFANPMDIFKFEPAAAMLIELNSGVVLFQLDPDERNFPASTTKIMTCLLALEHGNLQERRWLHGRDKRALGLRPRHGRVEPVRAICIRG